MFLNSTFTKSNFSRSTAELVVFAFGPLKANSPASGMSKNSRGNDKKSKRCFISCR